MTTSDFIGGYRLLQRLGTGGAGTVWLAEDGYGEQVALKLIHPAHAATQEARERLVRETRIVNSIETPGVARVIDMEVDDIQPFVVMEYIDGPTLSDLIAKGPLSIADVARLARSLYGTLSAVHQAQVVHRDVKPSNIILAERGAVLIDFGIALGADDSRLTSTGLVSGTAGFAAPELLRGDDATPESDWWALAATLLSALTSRPPFGRGASAHVLSRVMEGNADLQGLPSCLIHPVTAALDPEVTRRLDPLAFVEELEASAGLTRGQAQWEGIPEVLTEEEFVAQATTVLTPPTHPIPDLDNKGVTQVLASGVVQEVQGGEGHTQVLSQPGMPETRPLPAGQSFAPVPTQPQVAQPMSSGQVTGYPFTPIQLDPQMPAMSTYEPRIPPSAFFVGLFTSICLPIIPVLAGMNGLIALLFGYALVGMVGYLHMFRENRRIKNDGKRASDIPVMIGWSPVALLQSVGAGAVSLLVATLLGSAAWWGARLFILDRLQTVGSFTFWKWTVTEIPSLAWPFELVTNWRQNLGNDQWITHGVWMAVILVLFGLILALMWVMPTSSGIRRGGAVIWNRLAPHLWLRVLFGFFALAIVIATWFIATSN